jgi:hypothetical protein
MALETLEGIEEVNGERMTQEGSNGFQPPMGYIHVDHGENEITFRIQDGPIKSVGKNGCQIDELVAVARLILEGFNKNIPCRETSLAITKLQEAEMWLRERTADRVKRGVEGKYEA